MSALSRGSTGAFTASSQFYHALYKWNALLVTSTVRPLHTLNSTHRKTPAPLRHHCFPRETRSYTNAATELGTLEDDRSGIINQDSSEIPEAESLEILEDDSLKIRQDDSPETGEDDSSKISEDENIKIREVDGLETPQDDSPGIREDDSSKVSLARKKTIFKMKSIMRNHSQPIALITAGGVDTSAVTSLDGQDFQAITVSSFTTVTLKNQPVVSFNIKMPSRTQHVITANPKQIFRISILKPTRDSALIAHFFTLGNAKESLKTLTHLGIPHEWPTDEPLRFPNAASAELLCKVTNTVRVFDHQVVIATVLQASSLTRDSTLSYQSLTYRKLGPPLENAQKQWISQERTADDIRYLASRIQQRLEPVEPLKRGGFWKNRGIHGMLKALSIPHDAYNDTDLKLTLKLLKKRDPTMIDDVDHVLKSSSIRGVFYESDFHSGNNATEPGPGKQSLARIAQEAVTFLCSPEWQQTGLGYPSNILELGQLLDAADIPAAKFADWQLKKVLTRMCWHSKEFHADFNKLPHLLTRAEKTIHLEFDEGTSLDAVVKMCEDNVWFDQKETDILGLNRLTSLVKRLHTSTEEDPASDSGGNAETGIN